ncbi:MAG: pyridoxamine 5'-phosphate oxidase family protein [Georgfuchsia sp.]
MNPDYANTLRTLLRTQEIAALGTLHDGQPFVSMVPFAMIPGNESFVIHVSRLATHTKDIQLNPQVSLMVVAPPAHGIPAQALARITVQGQALPCTEANHTVAKAAYLLRFPHSAEMFDFADFALFTIEPNSIRFVGGFGQATSITPETFANTLSQG